MRHQGSASGFSIIEVVIVAGILGVVMMFVTSTLIGVQKSQKMVAQKFEIAELNDLLQKVISDPAKCNWQLSAFSVDTTRISTTPTAYEQNITRIRFGFDATAPVLAENNLPLPNSLNGLEVQSVKLRNMLLLGSAAVPSQIVADVEVAFRNATMPIPLKPSKGTMLLNLNTADPVNNMRITGCSAPPTGPVGAQRRALIAFADAGDATDGGVCTELTWLPRQLNVEQWNTIPGATLAGGIITLPAGTYRVHGLAQADDVDDHRVRWQNIDDNISIYGITSYAGNPEGEATVAPVVGRFQISSAKRFQLQHICENSDGDAWEFGGNAPFGVRNIYAIVEIEQD